VWQGKNADPEKGITVGEGVLLGREKREALGIEINRHISGDFSTLYVRQKVWHGSVQPFLKTESGDRDIDLHPSIATML